MKLQILVSIYNEGFDTLKPLLDSIAVQQNVPFDEIGVIVCNDGGDRINWTHYSHYLRYYPFAIDYYYEEHGGVSAVRNKALDHATADYVMFCDCDDMFANVCGLWLIFNEIQNGFDVFVSKFMEEVRYQGAPQYITKPWDSTFIHGKAFRRQYLIDNGIRFNESLTIHEDTYFNCLAQQLSDSVIFCPTPFYLWKWRDNSVVRREEDFLHATYEHLLKATTALADELLRRGRKADAIFVAVNIMYEAYLKLTEWNDPDADALFVKYLKPYRGFEREIPEAHRELIIKRRGQKKPIDEQMFQRWLNEIMSD